MNYTIEAKSISNDDAELNIKQTKIVFGTTDKTAEQLANPAELFLGSFAACILKNVERFSELLNFDYDAARIMVKATRLEKPPRMEDIEYELTVFSNDERLKTDLLKKNIEKFGTIYNTVKRTCSITGKINKKERKKMQNTVKLGYCPTMTPYSETFDKNIENIELVPMPGAAIVMNALKSGAIDAALIGREAYERELNSSIKKKRLQGGYTLVYKDKVGIPKEQLKEISIKTYLPKEIARNILPTLDNVVFYPSLEACEEEKADMPMLIDWKDFHDRHEMFIPKEPDGMKTPIFRAPVIFYNDKIEDFIESNFKNME